MKKFEQISIAILLVVSLCISPIYAAGITIGDPIDSDAIITVSVISNTLREHLDEADENELIPVTIQLNDDIDLEEVEQLAITHTELSSNELAIMSVEASTLSEEENETQQIAAMAIQDKIAVERNAILKEYYNNKNSEFITSLGLSESQIGSVGIFTPFIRDVLLTPAQIRALATNLNVCYIDYLDNDEGTDFDTIKTLIFFEKVLVFFGTL